MSSVIDILAILDEDAIIRQIQFTSSLSDEIKGDIQHWSGAKMTEIPGAEWDFEHKIMCWRAFYFEFEMFQISDTETCLLLRRENVREKLMEAALNSMDDSIQLYDIDANIQFLNQATKRLCDIPLDQDVEGRSMLDYFAVYLERSTTLYTLRTRSPVHNKFYSYKSTTGKPLDTVNSAFPVMDHGRLIGCVSLEHDMSIVKKVLPEWTAIQQILTSRLPSNLNPAKKNTHYTLQDLVGSSPELLAAIDLAARMAPKDNPILIQGETGTGKEIFAQGIHELSARKNGPFIAINCAAIPESLIEGMLFGTVKGAFTGSVERMGLIEAANHGTLFLDELNSMSLAMQAKLLRVLQEKTLQRVGSTANIPVDIRLISSCNEDALALSEGGKLRRDLFYRVASIILVIPPLRDRKEDLETLTWHYIGQNQDLASQPITKIEPGFWRELWRHDWPGNVRELFHILSYSVSVTEDGVLRDTDFPAYFKKQHTDRPNKPEKVLQPPGQKEQLDFRPGLSSMVHSYERYVLEQAYEFCGRNATRMAELLKISRQNCQYYIKKYRLNQ